MRAVRVMKRQRKLLLGMWVRAMFIAAGTPGGAYEADVLRSYVECEVPRVARSALYCCFDAPLEQCMTALADRALAYVRARQIDLPSIPAGSRIGTSPMPPRSEAATPCETTSPGLGTMQHSRGIQSSPSAAGRQYATIAAWLASMTAGICRATSPGRDMACRLTWRALA